MKFLRIGLVMFLFVRLVLIVPRLSAIFRGKPLQVGARACEYRVRRNYRDRSIEGVDIGIEVENKLRFRIQPETRFDVIAKALGVAREWQTDDADFDSRVFI